MGPDFRHSFDPHKHCVFFKIYRKTLFSVDGRLRISHLDHVESNNSKPKQNMSNFTLRDTFNGRNISNHRTLRAALESERKFIKSVRKSNGPNSYIPTKILFNGETLNEAMMNDAIDIGIQMMSSH